MPTMEEIYQAHSFEYDELVRHEDHEKRLPRKLLSLAEFQGKSVVEFGIGTGRVTEIYAGQAASVLGLDRSAHMLEKARKNLARFGPKITFSVNDNVTFLPGSGKQDIAIEGWSFGHVISENPTSVKRITRQLLDNCRKYLKPNGQVIIIETLGTNVEIPAPPKEALRAFYELLERRFGFEGHVVRTDYRFESVAEAARIMGFFFGDKMKKDVQKRASAIIPEFTGVWFHPGLSR